MHDGLSHTPLHDWHAAHGGRMVDFAGWSMPVRYASITEEHNATRNALGLFDVSHMGRFHFEGPHAGEFLDRIVTRRVADMPPGKILYGLLTNEQGGVLDDVLVYHLQDDGRPHYQMVVNAGNRSKIADWIRSHLGAANVEFTDRTAATAMIAVQGPRAVELVDPLLDADLAAMKYYTGCNARLTDAAALVSRTGYTGEDGCELVVDAKHAVAVWTKVLEAGRSVGALPAGLGCRDTLRLEAAMPLYGHEITEAINPIQAGLKFAVNLKDRQFIGRDAIARFVDDSAQPRRVGLELSGRRVPREGYAILAGGQTVGHVTSGTFSPTLNRPIAMGYVPPELAGPQTELAIDIRGRQEPATVVPLPFYQRKT